VAVEKRFGGARRRTSLSLTSAGRRAFDEHVAALREITEGDARARK